MTHTIILVKAPVTLIDIIPYLLVGIIYASIGQIIFAIWKRQHHQSYDIFILLSTLFSLPLICLFFRSYFILFIYILFMSLIAYFTHTAFYFTSNKDAPKTIFRAFKNIFMITNHITVFFQSTLLVLFFIKKTEPMLLCLRMIFYSLYFAVLSREVVKNLCLIMAKTTGYYSKEGIPGKMASNDTCIVCTNTFKPEDKILTLKCGHSYHEDCLKGWLIIGQNNCCYYCKEGVDNTIFPSQDYWLKTELFIKPMMNTMRSFISFSVIGVGFYMFRTSRMNEE